MIIATIAGVATAVMIPISGARGTTARPLEALEHALVPWVSFAIVPLFAFANAGVSLHGVSPANLLAPVPLGIALGLFVGKAIGIYSEETTRRDDRIREDGDFSSEFTGADGDVVCSAHYFLELGVSC